mgnify:CR=1 FL=1
MSFRSTITPEEIERLEQADFKGEILVVDSLSEEYHDALTYLRTQKVLGFDTETKPSFHANEKRNMVALLQLSGENKAVLFRLTQIGMPAELSSILADSNIIKIGAAIHDDIKGLQHYKKFDAAGFVDLQVLGKEWGVSEKSVRKMAAIILNLRVSKSQQLSNWESQQLSHAQIQYAAIDAWVCYKMYMKLQEFPKKSINE